MLDYWPAILAVCGVYIAAMIRTLWRWDDAQYWADYWRKRGQDRITRPGPLDSQCPDE